MTPDHYWAKAQRAIASARLLLDDADFEGACNRAYYAMFDGAHAALLWGGVRADPATTKSHRGLIAAFGMHLVKPGRLDGELGRALNQVERIRLLADYTGEEMDPNHARLAVERAEDFLREVEARLAPPQE